MIELDVGNMTCGGCVASVTRAVKSVDPAATVEVDLRRGKARVSGANSAADYAAAVTAAGFPAAPVTTSAASAPAPRQKRGCCCG